MGKVAKVVAFFLLLIGGYIISNGAYFFGTYGRPRAISNYFEDGRLLLLACVFCLVAFPLLYGPVAKWERWWLSGLINGALGALHYTVFSLDMLRNPLIQQSILAQFCFWFFAGCLAFLGVRAYDLLLAKARQPGQLW